MYATGIFNTHSRTHDSLATTKRNEFPFSSLFFLFFYFISMRCISVSRQTVRVRVYQNALVLSNKILNNVSNVVSVAQ